MNTSASTLFAISIACIGFQIARGDTNIMGDPGDQAEKFTSSDVIGDLDMAQRLLVKLDPDKKLGLVLQEIKPETIDDPRVFITAPDIAAAMDIAVELGKALGDVSSSDNDNHDGEVYYNDHVSRFEKVIKVKEPTSSILESEYPIFELIVEDED